jgi:hypothetical protein
MKKLPVSKSTMCSLAVLVFVFLVGVLVTALYVQMQSPSSSPNPSVTPSYVVEYINGNYIAVDSQGKPAYSSIDATAVGNYAIANGKSVTFIGKIVLTAPIAVEHSSVTISGENIGGDLFYTNDPVYHGFSNKWGTTIIADGFDAFEVGKTNFVLGVTIQNLGISGKNSDAVMADTDYSADSGIRVYKVNMLQISNVEVTRKEKGIRLEPIGNFAYDNVIDVVTLDNIYLCYNQYGIYSNGWVANARLSHVWGYFNQFGLIHAAPQYDWIISKVWSNADAWIATDFWDNSIFLTTSRDVTLEDITITGAKGITLNPKSLIGLSLGVAGSPGDEWIRAHITMNRISLFESYTDAITVVGKGQVDINYIQAGSTGSTSFYGGPGTIAGSVLKNLGGKDVSIYVNGGYVNSLQARSTWFYGILNGTVENVRNYNPYGIFDFNPFSVTESTLGLYTDVSSQHNPQANVTYRIVVTDILITSIAGTGVNITIIDPDGDVLATGLISLNATLVPVGYGINWGAFSVAPTILTIAGK